MPELRRGLTFGRKTPGGRASLSEIGFDHRAGLVIEHRHRAVRAVRLDGGLLAWDARHDHRRANPGGLHTVELQRHWEKDGGTPLVAIAAAEVARRRMPEYGNVRLASLPNSRTTEHVSAR